MVSVAFQFYTFLTMVLTGIVLCLLFDLVRALRHVTHPRGLRAAAGDAVLWLLGVVLASVGLFFANWGEMRYYVVVALLCGALAYFLLASRTVLWAAERGLRRLANMLRALRWLARRLWAWLARLLRSIGGALAAAGRGLAAVGRVFAVVGRGFAALGRALSWPARAIRGQFRRLGRRS